MATGKRRRRTVRRRQNRFSMILVTMVVVMILVVVGISQIGLNKKFRENEEVIASLEQQIEQEKARRHEIMDYEEYTHTKEFVEEIAHDKLGLVYENEIIIKKE